METTEASGTTSTFEDLLVRDIIGYRYSVPALNSYGVYRSL